MNQKEIHNLLNNIKIGFREVKENPNLLYPLDEMQFTILLNYIHQLENKVKELEESNEELSLNAKDLLNQAQENAKIYRKENEKRKKLEEKNKNAYWKGYIQKQNEAIEICKICKYRTKSKKLE